MNVEHHLRRQLPQSVEVSELALQHIWSNWLEDKSQTDCDNLPDNMLTLGPYRGYFRQLAGPRIDVDTTKLSIIFDFIVVERCDGKPCTIDHVEFTLNHTGQGGFAMMVVEESD